MQTTNLFFIFALLYHLFMSPAGGATSDSVYSAAIFICVHIVLQWGHKLLLNQGSVATVI